MAKQQAASGYRTAKQFGEYRVEHFKADTTDDWAPAFNEAMAVSAAEGARLLAEPGKTYAVYSALQMASGMDVELHNARMIKRFGQKGTPNTKKATFITHPLDQVLVNARMHGGVWDCGSSPETAGRWMNFIGAGCKFSGFHVFGIENLDDNGGNAIGLMQSGFRNHIHDFEIACSERGMTQTGTTGVRSGGVSHCLVERGRIVVGGDMVTFDGGGGDGVSPAGDDLSCTNSWYRDISGKSGHARAMGAFMEFTTSDQQYAQPSSIIGCGWERVWAEVPGGQAIKIGNNASRGIIDQITVRGCTIDRRGDVGKRDRESVYIVADPTNGGRITDYAEPCGGIGRVLIEDGQILTPSGTQGLGFGVHVQGGDLYGKATPRETATVHLRNLRVEAAQIPLLAYGKARVIAEDCDLVALDGGPVCARIGKSWKGAVMPLAGFDWRRSRAHGAPAREIVACDDLHVV